MANPYGRPPRRIASKPLTRSGSPTPYRAHVPHSGSIQSASSNILSANSNTYQMMDVSISVDLMEGLVMDVTRNKGEKPLGSAPITAVVSCKKNVSCSRQISTHIPSLPLSTHASSFNDKRHPFMVRWPADFDPDGDALSTFKLSRLMKRDAFYTDYDDNGTGLTSGFMPDEIELSIGLMRGSDLLTLGKTNLVITGGETEEMLIDLPISTVKDVVANKTKDPSPLKRTKSKLFGKPTVKMLKPLAFPGDGRRKFFLNEHAMIRLQVKITPEVEDPRHGDFGVASTMSASTITYNTKSYHSGSHGKERNRKHRESYTNEGSHSSSYESTSYSKEEEPTTCDETYISTSNEEYSQENHYDEQHHVRNAVSVNDLQEGFHNNFSMRVPPQPVPGQHMNVYRRPLSRTRPTPVASPLEGYRDYHPDHTLGEKVYGNTRPSSRNRPDRPFGTEMPSLTQKQALPQYSRNGSRSSSRMRNEGIVGHEGYPHHAGESRASNRDNRQERKHSHHRVEKKSGKKKNKPPMSEKQNIQEKPKDDGNENESPMVWLYDKLVGKGTDSPKTLVAENGRKRNSSRKKGLNKSNHGHDGYTGERRGAMYESENQYRRPSPKRTMRV